MVSVLTASIRYGSVAVSTTEGRLLARTFLSYGAAESTVGVPKRLTMPRLPTCEA